HSEEGTKGRQNRENTSVSDFSLVQGTSPTTVAFTNDHASATDNSLLAASEFNFYKTNHLRPFIVDALPFHSDAVVAAVFGFLQ
ncbi:unnamed protein product, partial [Amoebophrya sp. A120]